MVRYRKGNRKFKYNSLEALFNSMAGEPRKEAVKAAVIIFNLDYENAEKEYNKWRKEYLRRRIL